MGITDKNLCDSCTNIGCMFQSGIVRTECAFYMPPQLEPDNCGNYVVQGSTTKNYIRDNRVKNELEPNTKNDLAQERYQDLIEYFGGEDTVLKDRKEFKAWLERVKWHIKRADELARELEQLKGTTKNDLAVDYISRQEVLYLIADDNLSMGQVVRGIHALPSVTPQPRKGKWIKTPKAVMGEGYMWYCDKCNHEVYQDSSRSYPSENFCPNCGSDNREVEE